MRNRILVTIVMTAALVTSAAWATESTQAHHHRHHAPHATQTAPAPVVQQPVQAAESGLFGSMFKPYARPGEGDDDGLSRNPDDCMKGCIGGEPR